MDSIDIFLYVVVPGLFTILLGIIASTSISILFTLKEVNSEVKNQINIQEKIFKLIRYRRSQEVIDFLNKHSEGDKKFCDKKFRRKI